MSKVIRFALFPVGKSCSDVLQVRLEIWDTAGQEIYASLAPMYYRGAQVN